MNPTITDQLAQLEAEVQRADNARRNAQEASDRMGSALAAGSVNVPEIAALRNIEEAKLFRRPGVDTSAEALLATKRALLRRIEADDDLILVWVRGEELRVTDTAPARALDAARAALQEVTGRLERFKADHVAELREAQKEQEAASFKADLESGDKTRVRDALGLNRKALTTAHLAQPG